VEASAEGMGDGSSRSDTALGPQTWHGTGPAPDWFHPMPDFRSMMLQDKVVELRISHEPRVMIANQLDSLLKSQF